jgi:hypothetical protein
MRKITIGLIALSIAVSIFTLYSRMNRTPQIIQSPFNGTVDHNSLDRNYDANQIGRIGDVGVGTVKKVRFVSKQDDEITGEFGFEKLLYRNGNVWEVEQPYRNIFRPDFSAYMTADKGIIEVATVKGNAAVTDFTYSDVKNLTLSGNVVIRILPGTSKDIQESYLFLDDLTFNSDKSLISTAGPVKFISHDIQMTGKGLEIIYNKQQRGLEYCRILDIESLQAKVPKSSISSDNKPVNNVQNAQPKKTTVATSNVTNKSSNNKNQIEAQNTPLDQYYKCLISKNVLINTPEQVIFAAGDLLITDVQWKETQKQTMASTNKQPARDANNIQNKNNNTNTPATTIAVNEPNEPSEELVEITITCDDGITITPQDPANKQKDVVQDTIESAPVNYTEKLESPTRQTKLLTQKLKYNLNTGDAVAAGPSAFRFYPKDSNNAADNKENSSITITAQKEVIFLKAKNQVVFDGNCICKMPQQGLKEQKDVTLSATKLTANLPQDWSGGQSTAMPDITAAGPAELMFYVRKSATADANSSLIPARITADDKILFLSESNKVIFEGNSLCVIGSEYPDQNRMFALKSSELIVNLPSEKSQQAVSLTDIIANGPAELDFSVDDISGTLPPKTFLPAKIVAQNKVYLLSSKNQVVFDGPCVSTITRDGPGTMEEFTLKSQTITLDIPEDINNLSQTTPAKIKHLSAEGGQVILSAVKKANTAPSIKAADSNEGIQIKCKRIDYEGNEGIFVATGPGEIILKESPVSKNNNNDIVNYALIENFQTVKYMPEKKHIEAMAEPGKTLSIKYTTFENNKVGPVIAATAGKADIEMTESTDGKIELSKLIASGGIDYNDNEYHFVGTKLTYDLSGSLITVEGDQTRPCYLNGALVDWIKFDPIKRKLDIPIVGPSSLPIR